MKRTLRSIVERNKRIFDDDTDEEYEIDEEDKTFRGLAIKSSGLSDTRWWELRFKRVCKRITKQPGVYGYYTCNDKSSFVREGSYVIPLFQIGDFVRMCRQSQIDREFEDEDYDMISPLRDKAEEYDEYFESLHRFKRRTNILSNYGG